MKKIVSLVFAGVLGGLIALGGVYVMNPSPTTTIQTVSDNNAQTVKNNTTAALPSGDTPGSFSVSAKKAMPAVVHISSTFQSSGSMDEGNPFRFFFGDEGGRNPMRPRQGSGSGVIYTTDGYIMTNNHVVENASEVQVTLYDNRKLRAKVIGTNPKTDLAVLKIEGSDFPTLEIADSDAAEIGDWVLAVGNPFELRSTVTAGIISAKGRSISLLGGGDAIESFIQTDAAVNPGNSGGALVDQSGALLGINTAIATQQGVFSGYSFAIPINLATRIVDDIIEYGSYQRPFLGVSIFDLDNEMADSLKVNITQGVVVQNVQAGGSAAYAGIQANDIIVKVGDKNIRNVPELQEAIGSSKVGETVTLTLLRNQRRKNVDIRLKAKLDSGN